MTDDQHDPVERRLRDALRAPTGAAVDANAFLDQVHRGARQRRTRQVVVSGVAAACLVAVAGVAFGTTGLLDRGERAPVADDATGTTRGGSPSASVDPSPVDPAQIEAIDVSAPDSERQWLLGSVRGGECRQQRCAHVFATEDGGESWSDLGELPGAYPVIGTEDGSSVDAVRLSDDGSDGWAFRGNLLSTHDGGATWAPSELPARGLVALVQPTGDSVLASVRTGGGDVLLRSPAATDAWQVVPFADQVGGSFDQAGIVDLASSEEAAVMVVTSAPDFTGTLLISTDDGATWGTPSGAVCEADASPYFVSATDDALWASCVSRQGQPSVRLRVSTDLGAEWVEAGGIFTSDSLIAARDPQRAAVVRSLGLTGDRTRIYVAQVGASDEAQLVATLEDTTWVSDISFADPDTGFLVFDGGGVLRTDDGGGTWYRYDVTE